MFWNLFRKKRELTPLEKKLQAEGDELRAFIKENGYEGVNYSIFGDAEHSEFQVRISFIESENRYLIRYNSTFERGNMYGGDHYFDTFEEAKEEFLNGIRSKVYYNRRAVLRGERPMYRSPVWDEWEGTKDDLLTPEELIEWEKGHMKRHKPELLARIDELGYSKDGYHIFEDEIYPDSIQITFHDEVPYFYHVSTIDSDNQVIGEVGKYKYFWDAEDDFLERLKEKYEEQL